MKFVAIALFYHCFFFGSTMLYKITQMLLKLDMYIHTDRWKAFKEHDLLEKWTQKELKVSCLLSRLQDQGWFWLTTHKQCQPSGLCFYTYCHATSEIRLNVWFLVMVNLNILV